MPMFGMFLQPCGQLRCRCDEQQSANSVDRFLWREFFCEVEELLEWTDEIATYDELLDYSKMADSDRKQVRYTKTRESIRS